MAGVIPKTYIIGIVMFCFFIVGGVSILASFGVNSQQVTDFNTTFDKMNDITQVSNDLRGSIENADTDFGAFGVLNSLISSAWQSLKLLFTSLSFMGDAYAALSTFFGVPAWIPGLLGGIVVIILIFAIWSAIFQRDL